MDSYELSNFLLLVSCEWEQCSRRDKTYLDFLSFLMGVREKNEDSDNIYIGLKFDNGACVKN